MRQVSIEPTFESWQAAARELVREKVPPADVVWLDAGAAQASLAGLLAREGSEPQDAARRPGDIRVPRRFLEIARRVACHRDPSRWGLLYGVLWRLVHENPKLLQAESDQRVGRLLELEREVRRDVSTMAAFVRGVPRRPPGAPDQPARTAELSPETPGAGPFVPNGADLEALRQAAARCTGCELYRQATQTVFGQGSATARIVLVGEQPGDQEDIQGAPFVGPAGEVLDRALAEAGLARGELYVTNAVKHFKFVPRGKRRIHEKPRISEIVACRPWLEAELKAIKPAIIVCLGATAAQAFMGPQFQLMKQRGRFFATRWAPKLLATLHPSAVLRGPDPETQARLYAILLEDLRAVAGAAAPSLLH